MDELYKRLSDIPMKRRGGVSFGFMIAVSVLWYIAGVRPIEAEIISMTDRIRKIKQELQDEPETNSKIENLQANIAGQKNAKQRLGEQLPPQADIALLLNKLHERARDASLQIDRFEQGPIIEEELYARIEIKMSFQGLFEQVIHFINELSDVKSLDRIVNVEDLTLYAESNNDESSKLRGTFLLVTFMSKSSSPPSSVQP
jgi:Tfp pilus assembly protein PilO